MCSSRPPTIVTNVRHAWRTLQKGGSWPARFEGWARYSSQELFIIEEGKKEQVSRPSLVLLASLHY